MKILEELNITPNNLSLYNDAFTHTSYCNEYKDATSYERLEFLGDKVVDLIVSEYLYRNESVEEGEMTKIRASHVCEDALYEYALKSHFDEYLRLGKGEEASGGRSKKAILADTFEAFVGALYLDQGLNKAKQFVNSTVIASILSKEVIFNDYKSVLQEYVQTSKKSLEYVVIKETGPSHDKQFAINVIVEGIVYGNGIGKTKKEAEQNAAKDALSKMAK